MDTIGGKSFALVLVLIIIVPSLIAVAAMPFGLAQTGTNENGIISSDTTWTKADSPYTLTGPVGIAKGATLMIEPGVTVNIGTFYLEVNGTLNAQGTPSEQIFFYSNNRYSGPPMNYNSLNNAPENIFMDYDNPTCVIENAVLNQTSINGDSYISNATVTVIGCTLKGDSEIYVGGSATIYNCYVEGAVFLRGASTVTGNTFLGGINIAGGSYTPFAIGTYSVSGNNITNRQGNDVINAGDSGTITGNVIWGGSEAGIRRDEFPTGSTIIEKNFIVNNQWGILIGRGDDNSTIQNNTIAYNQVGIKSPTSSETITNNNIQNNTQYNMDAGSESVTVSNNWWGTTDQQAISNSIYDSKNDFNLGTVNFVPFLAAPNPQAPSLNTPIPTPHPSASPSTTPAVPEFTWLAILPLFTSMLIISVRSRHRKRQA